MSAPSSRIRAAGVVLTSFVMAATLGACKKVDDKLMLKNAIGKTYQLPRRFVYQDIDLNNKKLSVGGLVQDDFRYKVRVSLDDNPLWDEVASDDSVADRFPDFKGFVNYEIGLGDELQKATTRGAKQAPLGAQLKAVGGIGPTFGTEPTGNPTLDALFSRKWVVDSTGAPTLGANASSTTPLGVDPVFDALTVRSYIVNAIDNARSVQLYDPDSLTPVYKPSEDPFPKPARNSDIKRWDLKAPDLPPPAQKGAVSQALPSAANFRKMAIYLKRGVVVEVREVIDIADKLKTIARNYDVRFPAGASLQEQIELAARKVNDLNIAASNLVRVRQLTLQYRDLGGDVRVALPVDFVAGKLAGLIPNRGNSRLGANKQDTTSGDASTGSSTAGESTTTTTAATSPAG